MAKKKIAQGYRICCQCKATKPLSDYLHFAKSGWKAKGCNQCSAENMARYWKSGATAEGVKMAAMKAREDDWPRA